jgi:hypothetical protein
MLQILKQTLKKFIPEEKFFPKQVIELSSDSEDNCMQSDDLESVLESIPTQENHTKEVSSCSGYGSASSSSPAGIDDVEAAIKQLMSPSMEVSPVRNQKRNIAKTPLKKTPRKKPENQELIRLYAIKTTRLPPSSVFAKPSEEKDKAPLQIIDTPHNANLRVTMDLTKEQEEEKLKKIRDKIFQRNLMTFSKKIGHDDDAEKPKKPSLSVAPCKTFKKRRVSCHAKAISKENVQKARIKRRQSCFVPSDRSLEPATKRARKNSLYVPRSDEI